MKILSAVCRAYYGHTNAVEPMYLAFTLPLRRMGHVVEHFDHTRLSDEIGQDACGERFVSQVRQGGYDLVMYQTGGRDQMARGAIKEAARHAPIVAFNSDDDWQWESYSSVIAPLFTYVATTYPHIYERHRGACGNLILSQWGALDLYADHSRRKDLDFTFAGQIYRNRVPELRKLWWHAGLKVYGLGSIRIWCPPFNNRRFRDATARVIPSLNRPIDFENVNGIWNRSRISYTPMGASVNPSLWQIKSRAFEMGLSGTLMLCQPSPGLERYYEPGKEFVPFHDPAECIGLARHYLRNEPERRRIAEAYYRRTRAEHMWEHRWEQLFADVGLAAQSRKKAA